MFDTIAAQTRAPLTLLAVSGESNVAEDLSALIARLGHIHAVRAQEFAALGFSEPHGNAPSASCRFTEVDFKLVGG